MDINQVIARFGGIRAMAGKLGHTSHTTVQGWSDRGVIPAHRQREVLEAATELDLSISAEDLIPDRATKAAAARPEAA